MNSLMAYGMARLSSEGGRTPPKSHCSTQQNSVRSGEEEEGRTTIPVGYCQALTWCEEGGKESRLTEQPPPSQASSFSVTDTRNRKSLGVTTGLCPVVTWYVSIKSSLALARIYKFYTERDTISLNILPAS